MMTIVVPKSILWLSFVSALTSLLVKVVDAVPTTLTEEPDGSFTLSYSIDLLGLTSSNDVNSVFAAALDANGNIDFDGPIVWPGTGSKDMTHTFAVRPILALLFGVTEAIEGGADGTDKDHIVLGASFEFTRDAAGRKWSEIFPGTESRSRTSHPLFVAMVQSFATGNNAVEANLTSLLVEELMPEAGFAPLSPFRPIRFSTGGYVTPSPSAQPSPGPTEKPSPSPSESPSEKPSPSPSKGPSPSPVSEPSLSPTPSDDGDLTLLGIVAAIASFVLYLVSVVFSFDFGNNNPDDSGSKSSDSAGTAATQEDDLNRRWLF